MELQTQLELLLGKEVIVYSAQSYGTTGILEGIPNTNSTQFQVEGEIDLVGFWTNSVSRIVDNKIYLLAHDFQCMKTLRNEVDELYKLFELVQNKSEYYYIDGHGWKISDYTKGHLDALCNLSDDSLSRDRLYYLAGLFGFVPNILEIVEE